MIDSMLFVFGYRAQKIRSKKLSVLIHSSDKHKDVQSCTVEVHFQKIIDKVYIYLSLTQIPHGIRSGLSEMDKFSLFQMGDWKYFLADRYFS